MIKKYLPLLALLAAILLFIWVKQHQRGNSTTHPVHTERVTFNRETHRLVYSKHAKCRMDCRHIDESEVMAILENGSLNYDKIETTQKGTTYPLEGETKDHQHVRIVFAPHPDEMVVVTVIDLDKEWQCNCN